MKKFEKKYWERPTTAYAFKYWVEENGFTGKNCLDVGCGDGSILHGNMIGLDISKTALKICLSRGYKNLVNASCFNLPFRNNVFNEVVFSFVIEHLNEIKAKRVLLEIYRVLGKNGRCIVLTEKLSKNFYKDTTHISPYTKNKLKNIMENARFKVKIKDGYPVWKGMNYFGRKINERLLFYIQKFLKLLGFGSDKIIGVGDKK